MQKYTGPDDFSLTVVDGRLAWRHASGRTLPYVAGGDGPTHWGRVGTKSVDLPVSGALGTQARAKLQEAKSIADAAATAGIPLSGADRGRVQALLDEIDALKVDAGLVAQVDQLNASMTGAHPGAVIGSDGGSIADAFLSSGALQAKQSLGGSRWTTGPVEIAGIDFRGLGAKAEMTEVASPVIATDMRAGILEQLFRRLTVADLLAQGTTGSNQLTYAQETTATNAAAAVAEAALKPESTLILALVNEAVRKIATWIPVSDEMLDDLPAARAYLDARMRMFVMHAMEAQLLNGSGTAPNLRGLLNRTGVQTITTTAGLTAAKVFAAVFDAITNVRVNAFLEPDAVVIHPTNWSLIRQARDESGGAGTGSYLGGNPFDASTGRDTLWNLPAVITTAIAAGTVLVGAFRTAAQVFYKSGLTVEASNSYSADSFARDMTGIRAEQRAALAVYRPAGFCRVTLTA